MPINRSLVWVAPITISAALFLTLAHQTNASAPDPTPPDGPRVSSGVEVEAKCVDDSVLKIRWLDDKMELVTKHGYLQIAVQDIRKIELAHRCPPDVAEKIAIAISKLGHPDYQIRELATADLKAFRERAYPFVLKATKSDDPEVGRRADDVVKFIQAKVPAAVLEPREFDVVYTEDSKIMGKLTAQSVRVNTSQFGDQILRLADVRALKSSAGLVAEELQNSPAAPPTLMAFQQQFGKELAFTITGFTPGAGQQASVWGTDTYTLDSNLSAAAVHSGIAKPGEAVAVRVRIVQSPPQFVSSFRNGLNSTAYGNYPAGGFEFVRK